MTLAGVDESAPAGFSVNLANFEGPFDLLLQLISKHQLDITEVALSTVTTEFIAYIKALGDDLDQTTNFLLVASTLLDLKTARLLPQAEVEDEEDLALLEARDLLFARLMQYRAYKLMAGVMAEKLADESRRFPRVVGLEPRFAELLPEVLISVGPEELAALAAAALQPKAVPILSLAHLHAPSGERARAGTPDRRPAAPRAWTDVPRADGRRARPDHQGCLIPGAARAVQGGRHRLRAGDAARRPAPALDRHRRG